MMTKRGDPKAESGASRLVLLLAAVLLLGPASGAFAQAEETGLRAHGPLDPGNGWPLWFEDHTGLVLRLCLPCLLDPTVDLPDPTAPVSFPDNFPDEAFWWLADARMPSGAILGGGQARLTLALEAAFFGPGHPEPGQQIAFARLRIRVDNLQPGGTYTVTHPYGVEVFENVTGGIRGIDFTRDVGIDFPGDFDAPLAGDIGPFLVWDPIDDAPAGSIGEDLIPHAVTGSPFGTNLFRIQGPAAGGPGVGLIETALFSVTGQIAADLPACSDGLDNDGDGKVDSDGGGIGEPDPQCAGDPFRARERAALRCGLGGEFCVALLAVGFAWRLRWRSCWRRSFRSVGATRAHPSGALSLGSPLPCRVSPNRPLNGPT